MERGKAMLKVVADVYDCPLGRAVMTVRS